MTTGRNDNRAWLRPGGRAGPAPGGGFTLLELIVVLGLVGLLLGLAAPSLRGFLASRRTADAAAQILALTQLASSRAAAEGSVHRLYIDPLTGTYWLTVQREGSFVDLGSEFGRRFRLPEGTAVLVQVPGRQAATWQASGVQVPPWQAATGGLSAGRASAGGEGAAYVDFYPSGRTEEAVIELVGRQGEVFQVVCESATEAFYITSPAEGRGR